MTVISGCDHTPHLDMDPEYEAYTLWIEGPEDTSVFDPSGGTAGDGIVRNTSENTTVDDEGVGSGENGAKGVAIEREGVNAGLLGPGTARLEARTVWGALRGLETFSQLVHVVEPYNFYWVNVTEIEDAPRFPHRGLLIDTARHFLPKGILFQVLDSMAWNKLNVLHWHIVDDQSFPYESRIFPNLTEHGAYSPRHVYTQRDVADIVEYARLRGIRVIPEFDSPGHTQGFGKAFPHLLTPCYGDEVTPGTPRYPYHAAFENFDPTNPQVYEFWKAFLVELKHTFIDGYVHLGLDEVFLPCWAGSPVVRAWMTVNNYTSVRQVERHYARQVLQIADLTPLNYVVWQDPADNFMVLSNNSLVQVWKDVSLSPSKMRGWREYVHDLTERGHRVILSSCWYINYISYGQDWRNFYNCDPTDFMGTVAQKTLVMGGEAAMWGEYVDATNLLPRLWPRAAAAAERLWSMPLEDAPIADVAAFRLDQQRCRMLRRGVAAQPILNGYCGGWEVPLESPMSTPPPTTVAPSTTPLLAIPEAANQQHESTPNVTVSDVNNVSQGSRDPNQNSTVMTSAITKTTIGTPATTTTTSNPVITTTTGGSSNTSSSTTVAPIITLAINIPVITAATATIPNITTTNTTTTTSMPNITTTNTTTTTSIPNTTKPTSAPSASTTIATTTTTLDNATDSPIVLDNITHNEPDPSTNLVHRSLDKSLRRDPVEVFVLNDSNITNTFETQVLVLNDSNIANTIETQVMELNDSDIANTIETQVMVLNDSDIANTIGTQVMELNDSNITNTIETQVMELNDSNIANTIETQVMVLNDSNIPNTIETQLMELNDSNIPNTIETQVMVLNEKSTEAAMNETSNGGSNLGVVVEKTPIGNITILVEEISQPALPGTPGLSAVDNDSKPLVTNTLKAQFTESSQSNFTIPEDIISAHSQNTTLEVKAELKDLTHDLSLQRKPTDQDTLTEFLEEQR